MTANGTSQRCAVHDLIRSPRSLLALNRRCHSGSYTTRSRLHVPSKFHRQESDGAMSMS